MPYDAATWRTHCDACGAVCFSDRDRKAPPAVSAGKGEVLCYPCYAGSNPPADRQLALEL